jgi:hypothetical protein
MAAAIALLAAPQARADEAVLLVSVTTGGEAVGRYSAWFGVYRVGERGTESYLAYAPTGNSVTVPAGVYDLGVHFAEGAASKSLWIERVKLEGRVDKTVDMGLPVARVTYTVTNAGAPIHINHGWFGLYRVGERGIESYVAYARTGNSVTVPAGVYDVGLHFFEGAAAGHRWLENLRFEGTVDRRIEVGLALARVTVVVTNGGIAVGPYKAWWGLYAPGDREHANYVAYAAAGAPITIAAGTYDLGVHFADGPARLVKWIPGGLFEGSVERTVEVGVPLADVLVHVTRRGKPLLSASCGVFPEGERGDPTAWSTSDRWMRVAEGTADVGCFFSEGGLSTPVGSRGSPYGGKSSSPWSSTSAPPR